MKRACQRALAFLRASGDATALASARALCGESPVAEALDRLATPDSLGAALAVLGRADDLGELSSPLAERVVAWVEERQARDGSWQGELFATGMLAGYLARSPWARPATLAAAGAWLEAAWAPERVKGGAWRAIAAFAHFFANTPHELSDPALQWCGRELERGYRSGRFDPVSAARVLLWCDAHALPGARLGPAELVDAILASQHPDGGWPSSGRKAARSEPQASEVGEALAQAASLPQRVDSTLDALVALTRWS